MPPGELDGGELEPVDPGTVTVTEVVGSVVEVVVDEVVVVDVDVLDDVVEEDVLDVDAVLDVPAEDVVVPAGRGLVPIPPVSP